MKKHNIIGITFLTIGVALFGYYMSQPTYLDAKGFLHEPFYLVGMGYIAIFSGIAFICVGTLITKIKSRKKQRMES